MENSRTKKRAAIYLGKDKQKYVWMTNGQEQRVAKELSGPGFVIADPKPSAELSVEKMKEQGIVGVYRHAGELMKIKISQRAFNAQLRASGIELERGGM